MFYHIIYAFLLLAVSATEFGPGITSLSTVNNTAQCFNCTLGDGLISADILNKGWICYNFYNDQCTTEINVTTPTDCQNINKNTFNISHYSQYCSVQLYSAAINQSGCSQNGNI